MNTLFCYLKSLKLFHGNSDTFCLLLISSFYNTLWYIYFFSSITDIWYYWNICNKKNNEGFILSFMSLKTHWKKQSFVSVRVSEWRRRVGNIRQNVLPLLYYTKWCFVKREEWIYIILCNVPQKKVKKKYMK